MRQVDATIRISIDVHERAFSCVGARLTAVEMNAGADGLEVRSCVDEPRDTGGLQDRQTGTRQKSQRLARAESLVR